MRAMIKYIAPWLAGVGAVGTLGLAPIAGAAPVSSSVSNTQAGAPGARLPQPAPTPFESGTDPLVPADVGADPAVPFVPGVGRPF